MHQHHDTWYYWKRGTAEQPVAVDGSLCGPPLNRSVRHETGRGVDLAEAIFSEAARAVRGLADAHGRVYAISLFVYDEDDDPRRPTVTVGYNTVQHWQQAVPQASSAAEAKWNYAFWPQNEIASFGRSGTPSGDIVAAWLREGGLSYTDERADADLDATLELDECITELFVAACCSVARRLHTEGVVAQTLLEQVPVLVHELEYYDLIADQNERCNPPGVAGDFVRWVRSDA